MQRPNQESTPQRTATRAPIDKPMRLQFGDAIEVFEGRCRNISIGGVFVEMRGDQAHGSLVRFELVLDQEHSIRGLGEVVWVRSGAHLPDSSAGIGIKFRFLEQRDRQLIFKLVSQHIKDRLASRPSMTAPPEGPPAAAVRPGMIFRPPEGDPPIAMPEAPLPSAPARKPPADPVRRPSPKSTEVPAVGGVSIDAEPSARPERTKEPVLESLPPLGPIEPSQPVEPIAKVEPEILAPVIFAEPPPTGERKPFAPPDDEPTLSTWNLEDASLDLPRSGSALDEVDSLLGLDPGSMETNFGSLDDESPSQGPLDRAPPVEARDQWPGSEQAASGAGEVQSEGRKRRSLAVFLAVSVAVVALAAFGIGAFWESLFGGGEEASSQAETVAQAPETAGASAPSPVAMAPKSVEEVVPPRGSASGAPEASHPPPVTRDDPAQARQPGARQPGARQPGARQPGARQPGARQPGARQPEKPSHPAAGPTEFGRLLEISWDPIPKGLLVIFATDGPVSLERIRHFRLGGDPAREVIRFLGVKGRFSTNQLLVGGPGVQQMRIGFHQKSTGDELHVVLDMKDSNARVTEITPDGSRLTVRVETEP